MAFYIQKTGSSYESKAGDFILQHHIWNDWWRYENLYSLYYIQNNGNLFQIGQIKIGQIVGNPIPTTPELPNTFEQLDPEKFISLGQDTNYYAALNELEMTEREFVLTSLNDIAFNLDLWYKHRSKDVVSSSLARDILPATITTQFHRMAHGGAKLTKYKFEYQYPDPKGDMYLHIDAPSLTFSVKPESIPATNIHVLIGRNGVGKTWLLQNMIDAIYKKKEPNECGKFSFSTSLKGSFANIVCVAFSVFDEFPTKQDNDEFMKYVYIGVKSIIEKKVDNQIEDVELNLDEQFSYSLTRCMSNQTRFQRWKDTISVLDSDPLFAYINLVERINLIQKQNYPTQKEAQNEIEKLFHRLSSGHKIVALAITRLVETVEESTLVLLDEPELHLHPPLLSAFIRALSQLLINRNGVAIITTHSPVILQEVPKSCVWIIRRSGREVVTERPVIETFGENAGVLTTEVFGLEVSASGFHTMLSDMLKKYNGNFEDAKEAFDNQLGTEALALLKVMSLQYEGD